MFKNLVSICLFVLKILSKNQILTSIKGRNSVANLRKIMIYITNLDLVNDYAIQNLVLIGLFVFKILSKNSILTLIKGRNSIANLPKFELIQAFMNVLVTCKKIKLKMKVLDCSQDFSHYKSKGIFPDAQGQLTLQSTVRSGQISNSSKTLWFSCLPAKMKKIRSKLEALECSQHNTSIFQTCKDR